MHESPSPPPPPPPPSSVAHAPARPVMSVQSCCSADSSAGVDGFGARLSLSIATKRSTSGLSSATEPGTCREGTRNRASEYEGVEAWEV